MKSLSELKFESKEIQKQIDSLKPQHLSADMKEYKKLRKQLDVVDFAVKYLETNPNESSILRQLNDQIRKLEITESRFETWFINEGHKPVGECAKDIVGKKRSEYNGMMGVSDMRRKIKMLEFLNPQQRIEL